MRLGSVRFQLSLLAMAHGIGGGVFNNIIATAAAAAVNQHALLKVHVQIHLPSNESIFDGDTMPEWSITIDEVPLDSSVSKKHHQHPKNPSSSSSHSHEKQETASLSTTPSSTSTETTSSSDMIHRHQFLSLQWATNTTDGNPSNATVGETAVSFLFSMLPSEFQNHRQPITTDRPRTTRTVVVTLWEEAKSPSYKEAATTVSLQSSSPRRRLLTRQLAHLPRSASDADQFVSPYAHVHLQATCRSCANKSHDLSNQDEKVTAILMFLGSFSTSIIRTLLHPWIDRFLLCCVTSFGIVFVWQLLRPSEIDDDKDDETVKEEEQQLLHPSNHRAAHPYLKADESDESSSHNDSTYQQHEENDSSGSSTFEGEDYEDESDHQSGDKAAAPQHQDPEWWGDEPDEHEQGPSQQNPQQPLMVFENTRFVHSWSERRRPQTNRRLDNDDDSSLELPPPMERHVVRPLPEENITFESEIERFEQLNLSSPLSSRRSAASAAGRLPIGSPQQHEHNPLAIPSRFGNSQHQALAWDRPMLFQSPTPAARRRHSFSQPTTTCNVGNTTTESHQTKKRKSPGPQEDGALQNGSDSKRRRSEDTATSNGPIQANFASTRSERHESAEKGESPSSYSETKAQRKDEQETNPSAINAFDNSEHVVTAEDQPSKTIEKVGKLQALDGPPTFEKEKKEDDENGKDCDIQGTKDETRPEGEKPVPSSEEEANDVVDVSVIDDSPVEAMTMSQGEALVDTSDSSPGKLCSPTEREAQSVSIVCQETGQDVNSSPLCNNKDRSLELSTGKASHALQETDVRSSSVTEKDVDKERPKSFSETPDIVTEIITSTRADASTGISAPPLSRNLSDSSDARCPANEGKSALPNADSSVALSVQSQAARRLDYEPPTQPTHSGSKRGWSTLESLDQNPEKDSTPKELELEIASTKRTPLARDASDERDFGAPRKQPKPHCTEPVQCPISAAKSEGSSFSYVSTLPPDTEQSSTSGSIVAPRSEMEGKGSEGKSSSNEDQEVVAEAFGNASFDDENMSIPEDEEYEDCDDFSVKIIHCSNNDAGLPRKRLCSDILPEVVPSLSLVNLNQTIEETTWSFEAPSNKSPSKAVISSKRSTSSTRSKRNRIKSIEFAKAKAKSSGRKRSKGGLVTKKDKKMIGAGSSALGQKSASSQQDILGENRLADSLSMSQASKRTLRSFSRRSRSTKGSIEKRTSNHDKTLC